jgi:excisionase family DNA binding protein
MSTHSNPSPAKRWLSTKEMASTLGISPAALRALARAGRVPFIQPSPRSTRFDHDAVIAALEAEVASAASPPEPPPSPAGLTPNRWGPPGPRTRRLR